MPLEKTIPKVQEASFRQSHSDEVDNQHKGENDGISKADFFVLEVHEESHNEIGFHQGKHDEGDHQDEF